MKAQLNNPYGRTNRMNQMPQMNTQQTQKDPEFDPVKYTGLKKIDVAKTTKKIGLKEGKQITKKVTAIFNNYNKYINDIKRINTFTLNDVKTTVEATYKEAKKTQDYSKLQSVNKMIGERFKPILDIVSKERKQLNKDLEAILSEKQFKKWKKYRSKAF